MYSCNSIYLLWEASGNKKALPDIIRQSPDLIDL